MVDRADVEDRGRELTDLLWTLYPEWCRLRGFAPPKSPLEVEIDEASGRNAALAKAFLDDILDAVDPARWKHRDEETTT